MLAVADERRPVRCFLLFVEAGNRKTMPRLYVSVNPPGHDIIFHEGREPLLELGPAAAAPLVNTRAGV